MENKLMMPVSYNAMDEQELTYVSGGADAADAANSFLLGLGIPTLVVGAISVINMVWGVSTTRQWLQNNKKTNENTADTLVALATDGIDATIAYASKSIWNAVVTVYTASNLVTWWPVTAIAWLTV